jgi:hypothetical protein
VDSPDSDAQTVEASAITSPEQLIAPANVGARLLAYVIDVLLCLLLSGGTRIRNCAHPWVKNGWGWRSAAATAWRLARR